ncbi:hypothetical protein D9M69_606100 [compost metagenome]
MSRVLAYCTSCLGKYFGLQPERSIQTLGLCVATLSASSCQGKLGWAMTICMSGKSMATSSRCIGLLYSSRRPPPQRMPEPMPLCPVWKMVGSLCALITS